jgi:hypothetical protein
MCCEGAVVMSTKEKNVHADKLCNMRREADFIAVMCYLNGRIKMPCSCCQVMVTNL